MASRNGAVGDRFVAVTRRPEVVDRFEGDAEAQFPVGADLERAIEPMLDRMSASTAIRRYATDMGVDLRDVLDVCAASVALALVATGSRDSRPPVVACIAVRTLVPVSTPRCCGQRGQQQCPAISCRHIAAATPRPPPPT